MDRNMPFIREPRHKDQGCCVCRGRENTKDLCINGAVHTLCESCRRVLSAILTGKSTVESAYPWKQFSGKRFDNGEQVEGNLIANKNGRCWIVGEMIEANEEYCTVEYWYPVYSATVVQTEERKKMNNMRSCVGCVWLDARRADGAGGGTCNCLKRPGLVVGEWGHWTDPKYDYPTHPAEWNCWEAPRKEEILDD